MSKVSLVCFLLFCSVIAFCPDSKYGATSRQSYSSGDMVIYKSQLSSQTNFSVIINVYDVFTKDSEIDFRSFMSTCSCTKITDIYGRVLGIEKIPNKKDCKYEIVVYFRPVYSAGSHTFPVQFYDKVRGHVKVYARYSVLDDIVIDKDLLEFSASSMAATINLRVYHDSDSISVKPVGSVFVENYISHIASCSAPSGIKYSDFRIQAFSKTLPSQIEHASISLTIQRSGNATVFSIPCKFYPIVFADQSAITFGNVGSASPITKRITFYVDHRNSSAVLPTVECKTAKNYRVSDIKYLGMAKISSYNKYMCTLWCVPKENGLLEDELVINARNGYQYFIKVYANSTAFTENGAKP